MLRYSNEPDHWCKMIDADFDIKLKVETILADSGFSEQRAAKMDVDDLLK